MRYARLLLLAVFLALAGILSSASPARAQVPDVSGEWLIWATVEDGPNPDLIGSVWVCDVVVIDQADGNVFGPILLCDHWVADVLGGVVDAGGNVIWIFFVDAVEVVAFEGVVLGDFADGIWSDNQGFSGGWYAERLRPISGRVVVKGLQPDGTEVTHQLRKVEVKVINADTNAEVAKTYTDANGDFESAVQPTVNNVRIRVTLRDAQGLIAVYDQERDSADVAWLRSPAFPVAAAGTTEANLDITIKRNNDTKYKLTDTPFVPGWPADTNVGEVRFGHLAVIYRNTQLAADFARTQLGLAAGNLQVSGNPLPIRAFHVYDTSYRDGNEIRIKKDAPNDSVFNEPRTAADGRDRPDNREFHEYSHHIMYVSNIGGANAFPPIGAGNENHWGWKNTNSADSWTEGFAEFMSAVISDVMLTPAEKPDPGQYRYIGSRWNLDDRYGPDDGTKAERQSRDEEEFAIASLLWDLYDNSNRMCGSAKDDDDIALTLAQIWGVLNANRGDFKAVYDAFNTYATDNPEVLKVADLDKRFVQGGFYDDRTAGPGTNDYDNNEFDVGETIGVTSWSARDGMRNSAGNLVLEHRRGQPPIPGSIMVLTPVDDLGNPLTDVIFFVSIEYDPPFEDCNTSYSVFTTGPGPHRIALTVPPEPSLARIIAQKPGFAPGAELIITSDFFWQTVDPFQPGGPPDTLLEQTFTLTPAPDVDLDALQDASDNCPDVANGPAQAGVPGVGNQTNSDAANEAAGFLFAGAPLPGDGDGDACDDDDDNDGFSDADERIIFGVGVGSDEEFTPCRTATVADPWPPDNFPLGTPDRLVDGQDLVAFLPGLFKGVGQSGYAARLDIFQPGGVIDGQDLVAMLPYLFKGCTLTHDVAASNLVAPTSHTAFTLVTTTFQVTATATNNSAHTEDVTLALEIDDTMIPGGCTATATLQDPASATQTLAAAASVNVTYQVSLSGCSTTGVGSIEVTFRVTHVNVGGTHGDETALADNSQSQTVSVDVPF